MIILGGIITFITVILSIKELGLVKFSKRKLWIKICVLGGVSIAIALELSRFSNIVLWLAVLLFLIYERNSILISLVSEVIALFIMFILDLLVSPIFIDIIDEKVTMGNNKLIISRIIIFLLSILTSKVIRNGFKFLEKKLKKFGMTKEIILKNKLMVAFSCAIVLLMFSVNCYIMKETNDKVDFIYLGIVISISYCIVGIIITFIGYKNIKSEIAAETRERQLKDLTEYNENLEMLYNDMRKFRHDYINILSSMAAYIEEEDLNGLKCYFRDRIVPLGTEINEKNSKVGLLHNIMIKEIKGVILTKVIRAQELGVNVDIDVAEKIEKVNFDVIDLSICIGILLDNAIESAVACNDGKIKIGFINRSGSLMIVIINSFECSVPPIHKLYEKGFSTKGENRGIGLSNLREILSKYSHATLDTIIEEGEFRQILEIY
ncbi:sensor histidine kinase [Clostridium cibarium]|uniref:sensor histidine kinase n=1 Tax=Clostridium cibarium TaxID=2762247 RepID=UPI00177ECDA5|nr:GHKL domain-containing protein [Clostridium cibarium]